MEILQIAKGRLKVTLTEEELREYRIDPDEMDYDGQECYAAFEELLAVVSAKTELSFSEGKTYVQIYPSRDGGCELFFIHIDPAQKEHRALIAVGDRPAYLCFFESQGEAGRFLALLRGQGKRGDAYFQPQTGRYLIFSRCGAGEDLLLLEFGRRVDPRIALYLEEHCTALTL